MAKHWKAFLILLINSCLPVTAVYIVKPVNNYQAVPIKFQDQPDHQYSLESIDPGDEAYQNIQLKNLRVNEIKDFENQEQSLLDFSNKLQRESADNLIGTRVATFNPPWFNRYGRAVIDVEQQNLRKRATQGISNLAPVTVAEESLENADRRELEKEPRESKNINAAPVWSSRLRKETLKRSLNPLWGSRFGREIDGLITQPLWSARFGREDLNNKVDPLWGSQHGRRIAQFDSQPIESAKLVRTVNFDTRNPLWSARFRRETISSNLPPIWSSRFGRDIISNGKANPAWGSRYGKEMEETDIQPLWNARFGRDVNFAARQPLWSARFGREAFLKNMAPVWSSRYGRGISNENPNPIWGSRYGREIDESNSQPLWSSRFGRVVNANTRTPLWSARFGREATPNQIAPIWSSRFGRETKDFDLDVRAVATNEKVQSEQKVVTVAKMPKRRIDGEDKEHIAGDQEITEKEEKIVNSLGEGFADDSTGSRFLYGIRQLKKAIKRNANGRQGGITPLIKLFEGTLKVKETGPKKQSNQESADFSKMKWRKATKEELQRLDDIIHDKINIDNADE